MKIFVPSIIAFVLILALVCCHAFTMAKMGSEMDALSRKIETAAGEDNWAEVLNQLDRVEEKWKKYSNWAALTIDTDDIEQLEISLKQSKAFARLKSKSDFLGEFIMFSQLVAHIPHREGFHWKEIL